MKKPDIISVLNQMAQQELGRPKRHRHNWQTDQPLTRGTTVVFTCTQCGKTKKQNIPTIEERKEQMKKRWKKG